MNFDNDQLDAFLIEADLINQKVKALAENRMSPEEFDRLEHLRSEDKRRHVEAKQRKQRQIHERKVAGRDGKGISKDFKHFCRACHKEYQFETPTCLKCKRKTMTLEERQKQLEIMVSDYKQNKLKRQQKKHKWEMWQKTQAMVWKKNSINYNKWDYFISDSEQEPEKDPILPTNDPNFKALQMDMQERKKRRLNDTQKAKKLKEKGNQAMKEGDYQKAMQFYTLALQHIKDIKSVYTNRALAFIKLKRFKKAIKDCTNVIEYMEVFEKVGENKDLAFKAFSRRSLAYKQTKQYAQALKDIDQALKIIPNDKGAILMKKQIEGLLQHTSKLERILRANRETNEQQKLKNPQKTQIKAETDVIQQEEDDIQQSEAHSKKLEKDIIKELAEEQLSQEKTNVQTQPIQPIEKKEKILESPKSIVQASSVKIDPIQQIKKRVNTINSQNIEFILQLMIKNKQLKEVFIASKGIEACLDSLLIATGSSKQALIITFCMQGDGVAEKRVWDWGLTKLHSKIKDSLANETQLNMNFYEVLQDIFEILVPISLYEPTRIQLSNSQEVYSFIEFVYTKLLTKIKKQTHLLELFIIYMSNLCSGSDSGLKNKFLDKKKCLLFFNSIYLMILDPKTKNRKYLDLKKSSYSLLVNLVTNIDHRKQFAEFAAESNRFYDIKSELEQYPRHAHNFDELIENVLSLLVNLTLETNLELPDISEVIFDRFLSSHKNFNKETIYRALLVVSRLKLKDNSVAMKWLKVFIAFAESQEPLKNPQQKNNMVQIVKILNVLYAAKGQSIHTMPKQIFNALSSFVGNNLVHQHLFCNTCNLFGIIIDSNSNMKQQVFQQLKKSMKTLVFVAKEKTGNWRKSAAILIAKSTKNQACKQQMNKEHGMDVLKSIATFVTDKK